jgi:CarD family transcriptional regulator
MLAVGDNVVYPMHGAGVIEAVEEHEVMGERREYFILTMPYGGMRVMIPLNNVDHVGLREVICEAEVDAVFRTLRMAPTQPCVNWNRRFNINLAKIKSGDIHEVAEVVRNLTIQDRVKKLSTGERRLLDTARQILVSELVLVCKTDALVIAERLDSVFTELPLGG